MMSDLMASLNRRRKGISGDKGDSPGPKVGASPVPKVGAMDRISAMIPPPKPRTDTVNTNTSGNTDEDWD